MTIALIILAVASLATHETIARFELSGMEEKVRGTSRSGARTRKSGVKGLPCLLQATLKACRRTMQGLRCFDRRQSTFFHQVRASDLFSRTTKQLARIIGTRS